MLADASRTEIGETLANKTKPSDQCWGMETHKDKLSRISPLDFFSFLYCDLVIACCVAAQFAFWHSTAIKNEADISGNGANLSGNPKRHCQLRSFLPENSHHLSISVHNSQHKRCRHCLSADVRRFVRKQFLVVYSS